MKKSPRKVMCIQLNINNNNNNNFELLLNDGLKKKRKSK